MKNRFTTLDVAAAVRELRELVGLQVQNIYDINSKTYLIKLQKTDQKCVILFESGMRIQRTWFEWPKAQFPSSFSMKLRKHVKQRRLDAVNQLGVDRIVDLQFGNDERAVHIIIELYDRGNIVLTDAQYIILNVLRPRTDKDTDVRFAVREKYPVDAARQSVERPTADQIVDAISTAKPSEQLRRVLNGIAQVGGPLIEHAIHEAGLQANVQTSHFSVNSISDLAVIESIISNAFTLFDRIRDEPARGYVTYTTSKRADGEIVESYQDYVPYLLSQHKSGGLSKEFPTFCEAVDEFYSKSETQKQDMKAVQIEKEALKKLDNVKKDQESRIAALEEAQVKQKLVAERILVNEALVDKALLVVRTALANQMSWVAIEEMRQQAADQGDVVAGAIIALKLDQNKFVMRLSDPYDQDEPKIDVTIDLALKNAQQNSRRHFEDKRAAAAKKEKTEKASAQAIRSAQNKAKETVEQVRVRTDVARARKTLWFEKFLWFISSENYIIVAGRDAQQNELLVKRYLRPGDLYFHADVRGAASVILRNRPDGPAEIPPKTIHEAATFALCFSNAWEAKVLTSAWWVRHDQVSRTAPSGEYLTTGSFMIRGKKNFVPPSKLELGLALLFRVDDENVDRHRGERKVATSSVLASEATSVVGDDSATAAEQDIDEDDDVHGSESENSDEQENDEEAEFPDVQVPIEPPASTSGKTQDGEEYTIIEIGPRRTAKTAREIAQETHRKAEEKKRKDEEVKRAEQEKRDGNQLKRGQKYKKEKIRRKYGDQDDEERELRMQLLGSRPKPKAEDNPPSEKRDDAKSKPQTEDAAQKHPQGKERHVKTAEQDDAIDEEAGDDDGGDEEQGRAAVDDEQRILDALTSQPLADDTILYALPMCAPYSSIMAYKYKVKLTPGTGKRGKAAKQAIALFQRLKIGSLREEQLLKALATDEQLARNLPAKVRVQAPMLHAK